MASVQVFQAQFGKLQEVEEGKDRLIENLIIRVKELEDDLTEKKLHLEREQETTKLFQTKAHDARVKHNCLGKEIESNRFVSVLIDGDCMLFLDEFVKAAQPGGIAAVRRLRSEVCEYVSRELDLPSNIPIRLRVYANTKGLASAYSYNKILDSSDALELFVRGFNMGHPMCDFIDAGDGKECADSKLKAYFNHDMADVQCRAILFGGSADNGYARLLQPHVGNDQSSNRIILLEGPPFAKELAALKDNFLVTRFSDVFRTTKLASRRVSFSTTPPPTPSPKEVSYATAVAASPAAIPVRSDDTHHPPPTVLARRNNIMLQNSKGQRLDIILTPQAALVSALRYKKQCNAYHILGECPYSDCNFEHGVRLEGNWIEARRWIARQMPCFSGLHCRDERCLLGHQCPDRACPRIGKDCRFPLEMHNVERT